MLEELGEQYYKASQTFSGLNGSLFEFTVSQWLSFKDVDSSTSTITLKDFLKKYGKPKYSLGNIYKDSKNA